MLLISCFDVCRLHYVYQQMLLNFVVPLLRLPINGLLLLLLLLLVLLLVVLAMFFLLQL